jgi:hypothetical protein
LPEVKRIAAEIRKQKKLPGGSLPGIIKTLGAANLCVPKPKRGHIGGESRAGRVILYFDTGWWTV